MDSNRFNQMFGFVAVKLQGHFNLWGVDAPLLAENNNINPGTRADGGQKQVIGLRGSAVAALVFGLIRFYRESFVGWIYLFSMRVVFYYKVVLISKFLTMMTTSSIS